MTYREKYDLWCQSPAVDEATKAELRSIEKNEDEIKLRFDADLSFGTAGLRGIMRAGTDAMNVYTVGRATQGLAHCILDAGNAAAARGVAICYDCRNHSQEFANLCANILSANGIPVYLFDEMRPTPVLSFAVLHLNCIAGINITASHNPRQYNGYKVYWQDGAQISGEIASRISAHIAKIDPFTDVLQSRKDELIRTVGKELDEAYLACVEQQAVDPEIIKAQADALRIVYTPLHGTGRRLVPQILQRVGIRHLALVSQQCEPDGNFPTVPFPNPEYPEAFTLGIALAEEIGSDLVVATDPDADRVGVMARGKNGTFETITGNQMGCLLLDYIIGALRRKGALPDGAYAVKSIVSTALTDRICKENGITLHATYTGFKYIAQAIEAEQRRGCDGFLLGFEESYGYLRGSYAKDKDAVVASLLICEMAAYYHGKGMTLLDARDEMFRRYGIFADGVDNFYMEGVDGTARRTAFMQKMREYTPLQIAGEKVRYVRDYLCMQCRDLQSGAVTPCAKESADMLCFETENGNCIIVRPSGTEPKVKLYYQIHGDSAQQTQEKIKAISKEMNALL